MRPLDFDFAAGGGRSRRPGWILLAIGIAFGFELGRGYVSQRDEVARLEERLARTAGLREVRASAGRPLSTEEFAEARGIVARFSAPWTTLFAAIEAVRLDDVSLLSIEPDAAAGSVLISGEGKDYLAVLTYVARLGEQPGLSRVHLARHEVRDSEPRRPVSFSVAAQWRRP
jgi:hypothetical protein